MISSRQDSTSRDDSANKNETIVGGVKYGSYFVILGTGPRQLFESDERITLRVGDFGHGSASDFVSDEKIALRVGEGHFQNIQNRFLKKP
jgi:hypothetical protein